MFFKTITNHMETVCFFKFSCGLLLMVQFFLKTPSDYVSLGLIYSTKMISSAVYGISVFFANEMVPTQIRSTIVSSANTFGRYLQLQYKSE